MEVLTRQQLEQRIAQQLRPGDPEEIPTLAVAHLGAISAHLREPVEIRLVTGIVRFTPFPFDSECPGGAGHIGDL